MHKHTSWPRIPGAAAAAAMLILGGCAEMSDSLTQTWQDARGGISRAFGEDDSPAEPNSSAEPEAAAQTAKENRAFKSQEPLYRKALAARTKGARAEAFEGFLAAAEKRHPAASYETARAYLKGHGVKADRAKGMSWMARAAGYGEARAQFFLAQAYHKGDGIEENPFKAAALFAQAAQQGHAEAQYALGETYASGRGVPGNQAWAARWYGKAAHGGLVEAQYAYGLVHARGLGLPIDRTEGYRWLLLAARAGHERAEVVRGALKTKMAPEMVQRAEAWAERFQPKRKAPFADPPTVMYVQQVLNDLGYAAGPVDGQPGKRTHGAIGKFQKKSGQPRDPRISQQLVERLLSEQAKAP